MGQSDVWSKGGQPIANATVRLRDTNMVLVAVMNNYGSIEFDFIHGKADDNSYSLLVNSIFPRQQHPSSEEKSQTVVINRGMCNKSRQVI